MLNPLPQDQILDWSKLKQIADDILTLSQTTNFRLFCTERVCRGQFQICWKWQKILQTGRKLCGKRRNCLLWAISPFPRVFLKDLYSRHIKIRIVWERVKMHLKWEQVPCRVENIVRKGEIACSSNFSFSHNVFHSYISLVRQNAALCGNGLNDNFSLWYSLKHCGIRRKSCYSVFFHSAAFIRVIKIRNCVIKR